MKVITPLTHLFLIFISLSLILYFFLAFFDLGIPFNQTSIILTGSFAISIIIMLIFIRGYNRGGKSWITHTLAAISLKFILYLFLIVGIYLFSKNRTLEFVLTFFVIYLTFTSYLLFSFVKLLKTKNLEK